MLTGIVIVLVIAVGLPLLAWWVGGRRFWTTIRGSVPRDVQGEMIREHGLSAADVVLLQRALARGRAVEPRLRPAAVDWARTALEVFQQRRTRSRRVLEIALLIATVVLLVLFVVQAVQGDMRVLPWLLVLLNGLNVALQLGTPWWLHRKLQRAIEVNSDRAEASGAQL